MLDMYEEHARDGMNFAQAHRDRIALDQGIPWQRPEFSALQGMNARIRGALSESMEAAAARLDPAVAQQWTAGNRDFGLGRTITDNVQTAAARAERGGTPLAAQVAQAAFLGTAQPIQAAAAPAALGIFRRGLGRVSLSAQEVVANIAQRSPEALGRFAGVIQDAVRRGPAAIASAHHVLSQNEPAYRMMTQRLTEQAQRERDENAPLVRAEDVYGELFQEFEGEEEAF
jgi:hypothetical protein